LRKLIPGDEVLADKGFRIAEDVGLCGAKLKTPAFVKKIAVNVSRNGTFKESG
jgi:hypothetical protein